MSIVKSAQLPNVGRCGGGLPMATFERLEPYVGKPTSTVLMGLGSGNGLWLPDHFRCLEKNGYSRKKHLDVNSSNPPIPEMRYLVQNIARQTISCGNCCAPANKHHCTSFNCADYQNNLIEFFLL
jgi:hypothetical protein